MLPAIENGFTFIAFLMFLAGGLLAMEKYTKWKVFNWVPPLVWIYILNMVFCTLGLYNSEGVSAAYGVLKNNLLYAMIFVMLLRCDFRKIAKLSGRMIAIFLGCSITLALGFIVGFPIFKGSLGGGETIWGILAAAPWTRDGRHTLLLQPQTKIEELRLRLCENGYTVTREHLVRDKGKLYVVMTVTAGERYTPGAEQLYGGLALEREALYGDYLAHQIARLRRRAEGLRQSGSGEADGFAALADALEAKKGKWEHDNGT